MAEGLERVRVSAAELRDMVAAQARAAAAGRAGEGPGEGFKERDSRFWGEGSEIVASQRRRGWAGSGGRVLAAGRCGERTRGAGARPGGCLGPCPSVCPSLCSCVRLSGFVAAR